jgi:pyochelin biosynthesis protein PchG
MRVVVAGTAFGRIYLEAVRDDLAGILAKGSDYSKACADRYGVPLYTSVDDVPDVDVACVVLKSGALGGSGTDVARAFLKRGIHVLQEHPVHADEIASLLREARGGVSYAVNTLYPNLRPVRQFLAAAEAIRKHQRIEFIDAACNSQVLYPLIDILGRVAGGLRPWEFGEPLDGRPFLSLHAVIGGVPVTLRVQNQVHPGDPDNHSYFLHRISVGCEGGVLTLADTHGPVLWNPRLHSPRDETGRLIMDAARLDLPNIQVVGSPATYLDVFADLWPDAVAESLRTMHDPAGRQWALSVSTAWRDLTARIGMPELINPAEPKPLDLLKELAC